MINIHWFYSAFMSLLISSLCQGSFVKFSEDGQSFTMQSPSGKVLDFEISRFSISQDTAQGYIRNQQKGSPASSELSLEVGG